MTKPAGFGGNFLKIAGNKPERMKYRHLLFSLSFLASLLAFSCQNEKPNRLLVFSKTNGFRHASIEAGTGAIRQLGTEHGFEVVATEDSSFFTEENLKQFNAVLFLNTSGDVLNERQEADFQRFIQAGGGFVGVHGAAGTETDWRWYGQLVGAVFNGHPDSLQMATLNAGDPGNAATAGLPANWQHTDQWYNFQPVLPVDQVFSATDSLPDGVEDSIWQKQLNVPAFARWTYDESQPFLPPSAKVLLTADEKTYTGGKHGTHPIAWCQEFDGGRSFYTGLGHTIANYRDSLFLAHLLGGIQYAFGNGHLDYSKVTKQRIPPDDRFVRTTLASNLDEPMELDIFPDGTILFIERKGTINLYDPATGKVDTVCLMPVYHEFEEGVLGIAIDPHWQENKWVYIYYSLMEGGRRNRLSRFVFDDRKLDLSSEKMLFEVPELVGCCHAGGSVEFGPGGNLYVSTGDNTNPFESDGFDPIDERPGRALWDAQKSAGNTNDLRGKILRITPQPDGTYTIPDGNLFTPGTSGTRPEIYVMGCRNPFRIAIDSKTNWLYWGDVGPDAGKNGRFRGPKGYDPINRAKKAGNYGWPFIRGHHAYFDYNFATRKSGPLFDPAGPVNNSPNNTGLQKLPPVEPSLIWYSYDESLEFPWVATGGKNPMAGPVFHAADFPDADTAHIFPLYFENKLFIYEWMRYWIFVVTLDENGAFVRADRFLPNEEFTRPMDMAFGPDGALYLLEYGTEWFARNKDARLTKIEFAPAGRKPAVQLAATPGVGGNPLTMDFSAAGSKGFDGDKLTFEWSVKEAGVKSEAVAFKHTFSKPGIYHVSLKVTDATGLASTDTAEIAVGNTPPEIAWETGGNQSFYWGAAPIPYRLKVTDREDGSFDAGTLNPKRVKISIDYLAEGQDFEAIAMGHQTQSGGGDAKFAAGQKLIEESDCKTCHAVAKKVNGPAFRDIANRYYGEKSVLKTLSVKIMEGGAGNWGETPMAAHPKMTKAQAGDIVRYILSLGEGVQAASTLPFSGAYSLAAHVRKKEKGAFVFQASYLDEGAPGVPSLSAHATLVLRFPYLEAEKFNASAKGVRKKHRKDTGATVAGDLFSGRYIGFENIDLSGIGSVRLKAAQALPGSVVEVHLGSATGELAGSATIDEAGNVPPINLGQQNGPQSLFFVFKNETDLETSVMELDGIFFDKAETQ